MGSFLLVAMILVLLFSVFCQINVSTTFKKYNQVRTRQNIPAHQVAREILDRNGLHNVRVICVRGNLTDRFSPTDNTVGLSETVYNSTSIGAAGVAAHECGHAVQHNTENAFMQMRSAIFPVVRVANSAWFILFLIGLLLQISGLINVAIILFMVVTFFQLITLPVEIDASKRALETLENYSLLDTEENAQAKKVLTAAAMTYVAALALSIIQLLRLLNIARR
jgi:Zn-dependent membrane protease YugP